MKNINVLLIDMFLDCGSTCHPLVPPIHFILSSVEFAYRRIQIPFTRRKLTNATNSVKITEEKIDTLHKQSAKESSKLLRINH